MKVSLGSRSGFTLVEILIVVIILGILAAVAIPQFSGSTSEARLATLDSNLTRLRSSVELYFHQHNNVYPGAKKHTDGTASTTAAQADSAFAAQLTLYSDTTGRTSTVKDATYKYGPYIKGVLPKNPFNELNTIKCDIAETDLSAVSTDGASGWKFYVKTGRLVANDGGHDDN